MDVRALHGTHLLAAAVFLAATLVLAVQLITPTPVVVRVGENGTEVAELGGYFRYADVAVVTVAATLVGAAGTYLVVGDAAGVAPPSPSPTSDRARAPGDSGAAPDLPVEREAEADPSDDLLDARRAEWTETAERLADNERIVYETVLEADGVLPQNEIVDHTDLSKATVSRMLDSLETKNLVERKRRGMGNVVLLR